VNTETMIVVVAAFGAIGSLPRIFFKRDGRKNWRWWATASPFLISSGAVVLTYAGVLPVLRTGAEPALSVAAVLLGLASVSMIAFTVGTHRIPIALWHQHNDAPVEIVTWGPYRAVRHPFYSSFTLALLAGLLAAPGVLTMATLVAGLVGLGVTARREERRLLQSGLGDEYREYMRTTGRFVPTLGRAS
jgi:protein-S-isoprenylcysteine O-methyltransferase Ste14